jgi:ABC-type transport system involved in multi-copper enzyme maturation permease subunit
MAQEALRQTTFGTFASLYFVDMVGIILTLGAGFLGAFAWDRERGVKPILYSRPVSSVTYAGLKFTGLAVSIGVILLVVTTLGAIWTKWVAIQYGLTASIPAFYWMSVTRIGVSLVYALAFLLVVGFVLKNSIATFLIYFGYWALNVSEIGMVPNESNLLFYWLIRFSERMSPEAYQLYAAHREALLLNRSLYLVATGSLLLVLSWLITNERKGRQLDVFRHVRRILGFVHTSVGQLPAKSYLTQELKIFADIRLVVALLLVFVIPQFLFLPTGESALEVFWALRIGELFLPVTAIVVYANTFSKEWEWRTAPLWQSRSFSRVTLVGTKWLIATAFLFAIYFVFSLYLTLTYVSFDWIEMLLTVFPPGLFLGTLGMFVGAVSRRSALAFVTPLIWWFFEMTTRGAYTGTAFLFSRTYEPCSLAQEACIALSQRSPWVTSKVMLVVLSLMLVGLSMYLLQNPQRIVSKIFVIRHQISNRWGL